MKTATPRNRRPDQRTQDPQRSGQALVSPPLDIGPQGEHPTEIADMIRPTTAGVSR
jgi:hypothetical protein